MNIIEIVIAVLLGMYTLYLLAQCSYINTHKKDFPLHNLCGIDYKQVFALNIILWLVFFAFHFAIKFW